MTESKYAKHVLREPNGQIERDGRIIFDGINVDGHVKSQKLPLCVIPAKAVIQYFQ